MTTEELIGEYLERLKDPSLDQDEFEELVVRVRVLQNLIRKK